MISSNTPQSPQSPFGFLLVQQPESRPSHVTCPMCKKDHPIPAGGAAGFPHDFRTQSMLEHQVSFLFCGPTNPVMGQMWWNSHTDTQTLGSLVTQAQLYLFGTIFKHFISFMFDFSIHSTNKIPDILKILTEIQPFWNVWKTCFNSYFVTRDYNKEFSYTCSTF